jgi:putative glutamine amidotransferase
VRRPLIGIPGQTLQAMDGIPEGLPHSWVMNARYHLAAAEAGALPVTVPLLDRDPDTLRGLYDRLDGLLLAGGVDLDPASFGEAPHPALGAIDPARDAVELRLARWAIAEGKPVLGLCRGHQVLNVAQGGTLWQDIAAQVPDAAKHDYFPTAGYPRDFLAHDVALPAGTALAGVFAAPAIRVNSMHHQAVKALGSGLRVAGRAPDGLIEALEAEPGAHPFLVGVQWHPEVFGRRDEGTRRLFQAFIAAASGS